MRPAKLIPTDLKGEEFLGSLPHDLARDLVAALEGEPFRVVRTWQGGTARCSVLAMGDTRRRLLLKRATEAAPIDYEAALYARAQELAAAGSLFPRVIATFPESHALLMEYLPGQDARSAMRRGWPARESAISIYQSLSAYYEAFEQPFSDFHPANVILTRNTAAFVDPAPPGWHKGEPGEHPLVTDLSLWTYSTIANLPWDLLRSPLGAGRLLKLNVELVALCIANQPQPASVSVRDIRQGTNRHFTQLWRQWPRDKVVAVFGWPLATGLTWAAGRRLRSVR